LIYYGTGISYLAGLTYGTVYGTWRGIVTAKVPNATVRINNVTNMVARYSTWAGNSLGVLTMQWAIITSMLKGVRGKHDAFGYTASAFASGYLFKVTAGQRQALMSGGIAAGFVGAYHLLSASRSYLSATEKARV
jgi:mitochondrial import inner membrane translocase subunit TIM23